MTGCSRRVLILATTAYMIERFNMTNIKLLQEMGCTVDVACNFEYGNPMSKESLDSFRKELKALGVDAIQLPVNRRIYDLYNNGGALISTIKLMRNRRYSFVHCHTPVGSVVARIAAKLTGTKVIYTAHGFHFFDGAPRINWLLYYPVEKLLSYLTDVLILINREDYERARACFGMKRLEYVPGIGIDTASFNSVMDEAVRTSTRRELGIADDTRLILMVGELSKRKNHISVLKAVKELNVNAAAEQESDGALDLKKASDDKSGLLSGYKAGAESAADSFALKPQKRKICICIVGTGVYKEHFEQYLQDHELQGVIKLLGYREDTNRLYKAADAFLFPSYQEGLSAALMEAMACGLPVAASRIRGNTDLIDKEGGILFEVGSEPKHIDDESESVPHIKTALEWLSGLSDEESKAMGEHNQAKIRENFDTAAVKQRLYEIYEGILQTSD